MKDNNDNSNNKKTANHSLINDLIDKVPATATSKMVSQIIVKSKTNKLNSFLNRFVCFYI